MAWSDLDVRARELLDTARVVLEGPSSKYDSSARSVPDSRAPTGTGKPTLVLLAQTLQDAGDGVELLRAIHWAELQLWRVRYSGTVRARRDTAAQVQARVLSGWIGSPPEEVAEFEPVTVAQVCRWRANISRDPLTGRPAEEPSSTRWETVQERALVIQQLHAAHPHLSLRALGMRVGVSHPTVAADLSRSVPPVQ